MMMILVFINKEYLSFLALCRRSCSSKNLVLPLQETRWIFSVIFMTFWINSLSGTYGYMYSHFDERSIPRQPFSFIVWILQLCGHVLLLQPWLKPSFQSYKMHTILASLKTKNAVEKKIIQVNHTKCLKFTFILLIPTFFLFF